MKRESLLGYTPEMTQQSVKKGKTGPISWEFTGLNAPVTERAKSSENPESSEISESNPAHTFPTLAEKHSSFPIVLLHGAMGSKRNWGRVVRHLSETHNVLTLDQRGHGQSDHPEITLSENENENGFKRIYDLGNYADDLKKIINELGIKKIHLLGHSMGGRVAAVFASTYPENIKSLILEDTSPTLAPSASNWIRKTLEETPTPFENRKQARIWLLEHIENRQIAEFFYTNIKEGSSGADWIFSKAGLFQTLKSMEENSILNLFINFSFPTLILRGEDSTHFTKAQFDTLKEKFKGPTYITISNSGHWIHTDQFESFIEAVTRFLEKTIP